MKRRMTSRWLDLVLVALVTVAACLIGAEPAAAEKRMFRVERAFFGAPFPPVRERTQTAMGKWTPVKSMGNTIPLYGGAGRTERLLEPFTHSDALVTPGNPAGGMFTLPRSFIDYQGTTRAYASTAFPGYTSFSYVTYVNGKGVFGPNNPNGATATTRVVFPTTMGNPTPNLGAGNPVTPTTTFSGRYDFSRAGSIFIDPGPNRFGGTMRFLYADTSVFYQYIFYFDPLIFKAYGTFNCLYKGAECSVLAPSTAGPVPLATKLGQITSTGMVSRFLLTMGTAMNKATTGGSGMNFVVSKAYYNHLLAPWTTGKVSIYNPNSTYMIKPKLTGYDKAFAPKNVTVTHTSTTAQYNPGGMTVGYSYMTTKEYLKGVTRVVSLVRPRLIHTYLHPRIPSDPIVNNFSAARLWKMNVYFLPEPSALLMLSTGILGLGGLYLLRSR